VQNYHALLQTAIESAIALKSHLKIILTLIKKPLLLITVLLPTLFAIVYYGFIASNMYTSESRFVVRSPQRQQSSSVLGSILSGSIFARSQDEAYAVHNYILSRNALIELDKSLNLRESFASKGNDILTRFPTPFSDDSFEALYRYYQSHIDIVYDNTSGITTLRTTSHSPELSKLMNNQLLAISEHLVNDINERARSDLLQYASSELQQAQLRAKEASVAVAAFRGQRSVFDPEKQASLQIQQLSKLQDDLLATKTQLAQIKSLSPDNPQIPVLQGRSNLLQTEINNETSRVMGRGDASLAGKTADFERLSFDKVFADRQLASALLALESARNEGLRKSLYLETIVSAIAPDQASEPKKLRMILLILAFGLLLYAVLSLIVAGIREHSSI
jgi:capsular polysaccharide transport system permease protein